VTARRARLVRAGTHGPGPVVCWMRREHRAQDNWTLLRGQELALTAKRPLVTVWCLARGYPGAGLRQFGFLLRGLEDTARELAALRIPFVLLEGDPGVEIARFARNAHSLVTDFDPLRPKRQWLAEAAAGLACPVEEVDGRNVCPAWLVSDKREYMARTIRPKIHRLLPEFLAPFPRLRPHPHAWERHTAVPDFAAALSRLSVDRAAPEVVWAAPGPAGGRARLDDFLHSRLPRYMQRNDPNAGAVSLLSPWLHFGMLSAQRAALEVVACDAPREARDAFLEELIVRRELADNFCLHAPDYDQTSCFPDWAARSLDAHRTDLRPHLYAEEDLERARTHDPLWNAAQRQMTETGHMHGWLRMYWAKKILEWTPSPEEALRIGVRLNDRWQLDGRDSNGYAGLAWSMGGVHDRPWGERPIFGTVRFMSLAGAMGKFDVRRFVQNWGETLPEKPRGRRTAVRPT